MIEAAPPTPPPHPGTWYTIPEIARIARTSEETVRHWIKIGRLPSVKPGRSRLVSASAVANLMRRNARGQEEA